MFPTSAEKYRVGGDQMWAAGVDYTAWSEKYHFHVGDWLDFIYQKGMYDVVEVNSTAYDTCSGDDPIANWSKGHNYVFELNETKTYYFICSRGFCYQGMKLKVVVEPLTSPSPAPEPAKTSDGGWISHNAIWFGLLAWAVAFGLV
nr:unnamed protein product [Ananas comosus var. bracteatus]